MSRLYILFVVAISLGAAVEAQAQSFGPVQTFAVDPIRLAPVPAYTAPAVAAPTYAAPTYAAPTYAAPTYAAPAVAAPLQTTYAGSCGAHYAARPVYAAPQTYAAQAYRRVMRPVTAYSPVVQTTYRPIAPVTAYSPIVAYSPITPAPLVVARPVLVGQGIYGQPTAYVVGQPLRNVVRYVTP